MTLPPLADVLARMRVVSLPLAVRFRGVTIREAALFDGPARWSEFSPFLEYGTEEASTWLAAALDFGWSEQPPRVRSEIGVNATVPAVTATEVPGVLARFPGARTAKVKVAERGQSLSEDVERVRTVRQTLGNSARIRVDANAGWSLEDAHQAIDALSPFGIEYFEQPCATVSELAQLRRDVAGAATIAADESVRKAADPLAVAEARAADLLILKMQPLGGTKRALDIIAQTGLPVVISSALDTAVGIGMGASLAGSIPELEYDCGLGTSALFLDDVAPLAAAESRMSTAPVTPHADALDRLAASADRGLWWQERVRACYAHLAAMQTP